MDGVEHIERAQSDFVQLTRVRAPVIKHSPRVPRVSVNAPVESGSDNLKGQQHQRVCYLSF